MTPEEIENRKRDRYLFDVSEANCNTCIHLLRIKHEKCATGFLQGKCKSIPINHPYQHRFKDYDDNMIFHPNDPIHMECYVHRSGSNILYGEDYLP
jgi:hypothetical protein